jgi:hypothetical protein
VSRPTQSGVKRPEREADYYPASLIEVLLHGLVCRRRDSLAVTKSASNGNMQHNFSSASVHILSWSLIALCSQFGCMDSLHFIGIQSSPY